MLRRHLMYIAALMSLTGCKVGGCAANTLGDVIGETGDVACDRRFVTTTDGEPSSFCQEVIDTLAVSQVQDDCRDKHHARTYEGRCPREHLIAGCKLHKDNDDGSEVWDWYYDVTELESDGGLLFRDAPKTRDDVATLCSDKARYEEGATFVADP